MLDRSELQAEIVRPRAPADHQRAVGRGLPVAVTEASFRIQLIADTLLQDFGFGKASVARAIPNELALIGDLKDPAGSRNKGDFAEIGSEGCAFQGW